MLVLPPLSTPSNGTVCLIGKTNTEMGVRFLNCLADLDPKGASNITRRRIRFELSAN